jgi:hypothetical protein
MATRGGRISLPLAVGVDCGHPRPPRVDHGHPQWPDFFFFLVGSSEANMATEGGRISSPGRWGGSWPPQWPDLSFLFFSPEKSPEVAAGGSVRRRRWAAGGGRWRHPSPEVGGDYLFGCLIY